MLLHRTDKARAELRANTRTLGLRERGLLFIADGSRSLDDVRALYGSQGDTLVQGLIAQGFLALRSGQAAGVPSGAPVAAPVAAPATAPAEAATGTFAGRRSLASTRMYLFDLCERLFARRAPEEAERFRALLRDARDRTQMLEAGDAMLAAIEQAAGAERAATIRARIALLLPAETADAA